MFYFLKGIKENEAVLSAVEEDSNAASKMVVAINQLLGNKEMYLVLATFIVILLVVYVVRRLSIDHAWTVASLAGILIGLTVLTSGFVMLGIKGRIVWIIVGGVISTVIALIQQFLFFNLDYSRTERVQFEDDEYYYYVKAVPKIYVTTKEKRVKRIAAKDEEKERAIINAAHMHGLTFIPIDWIDHLYDSRPKVGDTLYDIHGKPYTVTKDFIIAHPDDEGMKKIAEAIYRVL